MLSRELLDKIQTAAGKSNVITTKAGLYAYGFDASIHHHSPDIVALGRNTQQISEIMKLANDHEIPVTARGAGTALSGQAIPIKGGIVLDLSSMTKIKGVHVQDLYCVVEPGVIYKNLNKMLAPHGFFFPPSPGSGDVCTLGGMVACNASGMRAIKYGATRDYVLGMQVVLPDGSVVRMGTHTLKNSCDYQLEKLMVGSEGTLGIITEIVFRIMPLPEKRAIAIASFDNIEQAGQGISNTIASGLIPSGLEIMDSICIHAVNQSLNVGLPECEAIIIAEVDGSADNIEYDIQKVAAICRKSGASNVEFTTDKKEMLNLWQGRKSVLPALSRYGKHSVSVSLADDMSVPISKIPVAIKQFQKIAKRYDVLIGTYGHAGDGNLHTKLLINPLEAGSWNRAEAAVNDIYETVIQLQGTVSGEHGIGISKAPWMQKEHKDALVMMAQIKKAIDPKNIMNPGKIMQWKGSIIKYLRYPVIE